MGCPFALVPQVPWMWVVGCDMRASSEDFSFKAGLVCVLTHRTLRTQSSVHGPATKQTYLPSSVRSFALAESVTV